MEDLRITFDNHPAMTIIPSADGGPPTKVPMFPDQRLVRVNGIGSAYLSLTSGGLSFTAPAHQAVLRAVFNACVAYLAELKIDKEVIPSAPIQPTTKED